MSFSVICCENLLTPYNPFANAASYQCCNLLTPYIPSNSGGGVGTCSEIDCSSYTPVCFTVSGKNLCNYLAGIDTSICQLQAGLSNIPCASVVISGVTYPCWNGTLPTGLCANLNLIYESLCTQVPAGLGMQTPTGVHSETGIFDAVNGTFAGGITTGMTISGATMVGVTNIVHGTGTGSAQLTPSSNVVLSTSTPISVKANRYYEISGWIYVTAQVVAAGALMGTTGTGITKNVQGQTVGLGSLNKWYQLRTWYIPDTDQNVNFTLTLDGATSGDVIYFTDFTVQPLSEQKGEGVLTPYEYAEFNEMQLAAQYLYSPSMPIGGGLTVSGSSFSVTIADAVIIYNGRYFYANGQTLTVPSNTTSYLYYSTLYDYFHITTVSINDDADVAIWEIVTNGSGVTSTTALYSTASISDLQLQNNSVTTNAIVNNAVTDAKLSLTGVTAGTYGDSTHVAQFTVTNTGRLTFAQNVAIVYPVTSVNTKTGAVSLGLGDLNNVVLTSPSNGQFLQYNGTNWVNSTSFLAYYQTMFANGSAQTQRSGLNFSASFALTDVSVSNWTLVQIANNGISYGMIQQASAGTILGNSTGSTANVQEITLGGGLSFVGNTLTANQALQKLGTATLDMNSTSDQAIVLNTPTGNNVIVTSIVVSGASISLTTASDGQIWTGTSRAGFQILQTTIDYALLTSNALALNFIGGSGVKTPQPLVAVGGTVYYSLGTPQGSAATANIILYGYVLN